MILKCHTYSKKFTNVLDKQNVVVILTKPKKNFLKKKETNAVRLTRKAVKFGINHITLKNIQETLHGGAVLFYPYKN